MSHEQELILEKLREAYKKLELSAAQVAQLKNQSFKVNLNGGKCLFYAYLCNNHVKWGTSFTNVDGQRPKAHKTSIPNLEIGFVIYSSKENLQNLNKAIKIHFKIKTKREHLSCSIEELEKFVINYMDVMDFKSTREDVHKLNLLSILCKSN